MQKAQVEGWKIKIRYHEVGGFKNFFSNRGETDYFVDGVTVLDKDFANVSKRFAGADRGRVIDTVYVVVDKNELKRQLTISRRQSDNGTIDTRKQLIRL